MLQMKFQRVKYLLFLSKLSLAILLSDLCKYQWTEIYSDGFNKLISSLAIQARKLGVIPPEHRQYQHSEYVYQYTDASSRRYRVY